MSRYSKYPHIQPTRIIKPSTSDIYRVLKQYDNLDTWADEYYGDVNLSWIIMCANPEYSLEFEIPAGTRLRIPLPLERVWASWGEQTEI